MAATLSRFVAASAIGAALCGPVQGQESPRNALGVLNAYLIQAARSDPAYRAEIETGGPAPPSPGRFSGFSSWLGPFSYRPKTYGDLTPAARATLWRDPAFHAFLAAAPPPRPMEGSGGRPFAPPARVRQFSVTPEEMLGAQAVQVMISTP